MNSFFPRAVKTYEQVCVTCGKARLFKSFYRLADGTLPHACRPCMRKTPSLRKPYVEAGLLSDPKTPEQRARHKHLTLQELQHMEQLAPDHTLPADRGTTALGRRLWAQRRADQAHEPYVGQWRAIRDQPAEPHDTLTPAERLGYHRYCTYQALAKALDARCGL